MFSNLFIRIFLIYSMAHFIDTSIGHCNESNHVILLHGLARTKRSMSKLEKYLVNNGYNVLNFGYDSRDKTIEELADDIFPEAVELCRKKGAKKIHFITHSMGGILVRYWLKSNKINELGRVVMLSPPNGGSEIVDLLKNNIIFKWLNGPAGQQLGTDINSIPNKLGKINFEAGIITGDFSINLILSLIIPGDDDGKVSVKNAMVYGMKDFLVIHSSHPFIMKNDRAISESVHFLKYGVFSKD